MAILILIPPATGAHKTKNQTRDESTRTGLPEVGRSATCFFKWAVALALGATILQEEQLPCLGWAFFHLGSEAAFFFGLGSRLLRNHSQHPYGTCNQFLPVDPALTQSFRALRFVLLAFWSSCPTHTDLTHGHPLPSPQCHCVITEEQSLQGHPRPGPM